MTNGEQEKSSKVLMGAALRIEIALGMFV